MVRAWVCSNGRHSSRTFGHRIGSPPWREVRRLAGPPSYSLSSIRCRGGTPLRSPLLCLASVGPLDPPTTFPGCNAMGVVPGKRSLRRRLATREGIGHRVRGLSFTRVSGRQFSRYVACVSVHGGNPGSAAAACLGVIGVIDLGACGIVNGGGHAVAADLAMTDDAAAERVRGVVTATALWAFVVATLPIPPSVIRGDNSQIAFGDDRVSASVKGI